MAQKTITIGTRGSALALWQAQWVSEAIRHAQPDSSVEILIIKTEGDGNQQPIPLDVVGKGWFTKEIEHALLEGSIDIAVHSLKDLPEELPPGLMLGAFPERADARDTLVSAGNKALMDLPSGARVGTDSLRRKAQLLALRADLRVESIRGNVPTRLQKMDDGVYDAVVLAAAGLLRLGLENRVAQYFSIAEMTPAPGQGTLAIETRGDDAPMRELLALLNDKSAAAAAQAERAFAKAAGGGCKSPTGAYAEINLAENTLTLSGMLAEDTYIERGTLSGPLEGAEALGASLARELLSRLAAHG